ncbi:unnamed protein product [Echinostoma caproni]|uniref:Secreted protein n=1 Tax=Echinostoma caproni TaxID=27848 RepID=A0A183AMI5_9TREM|nr:unnamed protein product [Echinostoma caproni]
MPAVGVLKSSAFLRVAGCAVVSGQDIGSQCCNQHQWFEVTVSRGGDTGTGVGRSLRMAVEISLLSAVPCQKPVECIQQQQQHVTCRLTF